MPGGQNICGTMTSTPSDAISDSASERDIAGPDDRLHTSPGATSAITCSYPSPSASRQPPA